MYGRTKMIDNFFFHCSCFSFNREGHDQLSADDADFVDAIHTGAGGAKFGVWDSCGHKDFYPNGGRLQPGKLYQGWVSMFQVFFNCLGPLTITVGPLYKNLEGTEGF